jgi:hypothetical protein
MHHEVEAGALADAFDQPINGIWREVGTAFGGSAANCRGNYYTCSDLARVFGAVIVTDGRAILRAIYRM